MPYRAGASRRRLPVLAKLTIKTPCDASWDDMIGNDEVRYCCRCNKSVYDLSAMQPEDAEAFLADHVETQKELPCTRLFQRPDGRLLTAECAHGERLRHVRRVKVGFAAAATIAASLAAIGDHLTTPRLNTNDADFIVMRHAPDGHLKFGDPVDRDSMLIMEHVMGAPAEREEEGD